MKIGQRLKELRKLNKVTQAQLSTAIGVTDRALRRYESGENEPTMGVLQSMANYFDISLDYLTGTGLYSKEEQVLTHKDEIVHALNQFYDTDFFTKVSAFPDRVFMNIVASAVKDIDFLDDEDAPEITLYPLVPAEVGRNFFSTLK